LHRHLPRGRCLSDVAARFQVEFFDDVGFAMLARSPMVAGDVVFSEAPALWLPHSPPSAASSRTRQTCANCGVFLSFTSPPDTERMASELTHVAGAVTETAKLPGLGHTLKCVLDGTRVHLEHLTTPRPPSAHVPHTPSSDLAAPSLLAQRASEPCPHCIATDSPTGLSAATPSVELLAQVLGPVASSAPMCLADVYCRCVVFCHACEVVLGGCLSSPRIGSVLSSFCAVHHVGNMRGTVRIPCFVRGGLNGRQINGGPSWHT
jgi:hypothetical protein